MAPEIKPELKSIMKKSSVDSMVKQNQSQGQRDAEKKLTIAQKNLTLMIEQDAKEEKDPQKSTILNRMRSSSRLETKYQDSAH